ncbi:MAG: hypothetical protein U9Q67_00020 [Patescibacteria group bacterium]|nr:hypothetical protein [Patescibacteria group bacterium]
MKHSLPRFKYGSIEVLFKNGTIERINVKDTVLLFSAINEKGVSWFRRRDNVTNDLGVGIAVCTHPLLNRFHNRIRNSTIQYTMTTDNNTVLISDRLSRQSILIPIKLNGKKVKEIPVFIAKQYPKKGRYTISCRNIQPTNQWVLYMAQIFGHTTGWAPAILSALKKERLGNRFIAALKPGCDSKHFRSKAMEILGHQPKIVEFYYDSSYTTNITDQDTNNKDIPGLLNQEVALLWIGQNMDVVISALQSGVIFNDLRSEISVLDMLLRGMKIRNTKTIYANRYAFREFRDLIQLKKHVYNRTKYNPVLSRLVKEISPSIVSTGDLCKYLKLHGIDPKTQESFNFSQFTEKALDSCGLPTTMWYQAINWKSLLHLETKDDRLICIPPIARCSCKTVKEATSNVAKILCRINPRLDHILSDKRNLVVASQGTGIATNRQQNWDVLINSAQKMQDSEFVFVGVEEKVEFTGIREHERLRNKLDTLGLTNVTLIEWIDGWYLDLIRTISNKLNAVFICRSGLSTAGAALANGVVPLMMSPDVLPDSNEKNSFQISAAPKVATERSVYFIQLYKLLTQLGLSSDEIPPLLLNTQGTGENPTLTLKKVLNPHIQGVMRAIIKDQFGEESLKLIAYCISLEMKEGPVENHVKRQLRNKFLNMM